MSKPKIYFNTIVGTEEGITKHGRSEALHLYKQGYDIHLEDCNLHSGLSKEFQDMYKPILWDKDEVVSIINQPPLRPNNPTFSLIGQNHRPNIIYYLAFEGPLPYEWKEAINHSNAKIVLTPSQYCKEEFEKSGITKLIKVLPHGIDVSLHNTEDRSNSEKTTFLFSGTPHNERKGLQYLMRAWKDFPDRENCKLILKLNLIYGVNPKLKNEVEAFLTKYKDSVELITETLTEEGMAKLFKSVDCYISPSLSEGFGMQLLEAAACGTPCIATCWTGELEFANEIGDSILNINKSGEKIYPNYFPYQGIEWDTPDLKDFTAKLHDFYINKEVYLKRAKLNASIIHEKYSWYEIGEQLEKIIEEITTPQK